MSLFDKVIIVDWSGGNDRGASPKKDAIWACVAGESPVYLRNRTLAEDWIGTQIAACQGRVLIGFDFPFGYPDGFAEAVTGQADPLALWAWFEARVEDSPKANNRFDLAGELNRHFAGVGPFWGNALVRNCGFATQGPLAIWPRDARKARRRGASQGGVCLLADVWGWLCGGADDDGTACAGAIARAV